MKKKITYECELLPVMIPNFILTKDIKQTIPIEECSDEELEEIGKRFTEDLIEKAQKKRINLLK